MAERSKVTYTINGRTFTLLYAPCPKGYAWDVYEGDVPAKTTAHNSLWLDGGVVSGRVDVLFGVLQDVAAQYVEAQ